MAAKSHLARFKFAVLLLVLLLVLPLNAFAWGNSGHHVIAMIAERNLTPKTKLAVSQLLGTETLVSISTWADSVRYSSRKETYSWHFVNIPENATAYDPARDCPKGDCSVAAVERLRKVLADPNQQAKDRLEALKFIVHLIGDLHQPLHCYNNRSDEYGLDFKVKLPSGTTTNLHLVWDSELILYATGNSSERDLANALAGTLDPATIAKIQQGTPRTWAEESNKLGPIAYDFTNSKSSENSLDLDYYGKSFPVVDSQLIKGGVRLAKFLNDIFDPGAVSAPDGGDLHHRKEAALKVLMKLVAQDFQGISEEFPFTLQTTRQLSEDWNATIRTYGSYKSHQEPLLNHISSSLDLVSIRCRMEKGVIDVHVVYANGRISYISIRPVQ